MGVTTFHGKEMETRRSPRSGDGSSQLSMKRRWRLSALNRVEMGGSNIFLKSGKAKKILQLR
jgi:hypothetical protein